MNNLLHQYPEVHFNINEEHLLLKFEKYLPRHLQIRNIQGTLEIREYFLRLLKEMLLFELCLYEVERLVIRNCSRRMPLSKIWTYQHLLVYRNCPSLIFLRASLVLVPKYKKIERRSATINCTAVMHKPKIIASHQLLH